MVVSSLTGLAGLFELGGRDAAWRTSAEPATAGAGAGWVWIGAGAE